MEHRSVAVLLVERERGVIDRVRGILGGADENDGARLVVFGSLADAAQELAEGDVDVMLLGPSLSRTKSMDAVSAARQRLPWLPIVVLVPSLEESADVMLLRAGAQDVVATDDDRFGDLKRAVRYAVERSPLQGWAQDVDGDDTIGGDTGDLDRMCGPSPVPSTGRTLGSVPLRTAFTSAHVEILDEYGELLDLAFERRVIKGKGALSERLNALADRLGLLSAGPRDVVDLHKAAIALKLVGLPRRKARAYAVEGRLLLLQLMGYLVAFYRGLTWGRRGVAPENFPAEGQLADPVPRVRNKRK